MLITCLALVDMLALLLVSTVICVCQRVGQLTRTHGRLRRAGRRLGILGNRLCRVGSHLRSTGLRLSRSGQVGRRCVKHFVDLYSSCVSGLSNCHHVICGVISSKRVKRLIGIAQSSGNLRTRLGTLCGGFSATFLRLFPGFIARFGSLLLRSRRIMLGESRLLGARLHVFTLVHLKVGSDSRVTRFLHCSIGAVCGCQTGMGGGTYISESSFRGLIQRVRWSFCV